ncbi:MAG: C40 family peptidase [Clostridiales bacterium]|jgi:hypothetical protein|nr:C40 family peptidase [Clostridiales bacterium]
MRLAICVRDITPLYVQPSESSELADEALYGAVLEILSEAEGGFARVRTQYRYEGYTLLAPLLEGNGKVEAWSAAPKWTVWAPYLDVKRGPRVQDQTIACLTRGGLLERLESEEILEDGYIQVGLADGRRGYIRKPCAEPQITAPAQDEAAGRAAIIRAAKTYMGVQYRWGGRSPLGIDCSGLTGTSYFLNGYTIYRDAELREGFDMREIPFDEKKPGDLIFFKGHVAMYLGGGMFIHSTASPSAGGVVLNSFDPARSDYRGDLLEKVVKTGSVF